MAAGGRGRLSCLTITALICIAVLSLLLKVLLFSGSAMKLEVKAHFQKLTDKEDFLSMVPADEGQIGQPPPVCANGMIRGVEEEGAGGEREGVSELKEPFERGREEGSKGQSKVREGTWMGRLGGWLRGRFGGGSGGPPALTWAGGPRGVREAECALGLFYVYEMPEEFNVGIVRDCGDPNGDFCKRLRHHGMGPHLLPEDPGCEKVPGTYSHLFGNLSAWFNSQAHSYEPTIHERLKQHPCRTYNPKQALAFYLPFYASLAQEAAGTLSSSGSVDRSHERFLEWLEHKPYFRRLGGRDHFLILGHIAWNFKHDAENNYGSQLLKSPIMEHVIKMSCDRDLWDHTMTSIPYPTSFHPSTDEQLRQWQERVRTVPRKWRAVFVGSKARGEQFEFSKIHFDFRSLMVDKCEEWEECAFFDCHHIGDYEDETMPCRQPGPPMSFYMNSDFCLQPQGDTPARKSVFDSMLAGCVPVFFTMSTAYNQYHWYLPMERKSYSVYIDGKAVKNGTVSISEVLSRYTREQIESMRRVVIDEIMPGIIVGNPENFDLRTTQDAASLAVNGVLVRVRRHIEGREYWFPDSWDLDNLPKRAYSFMQPQK